MLLPNTASRTGGEILIDQLLIHGARHVFCVPGESYIAALDAMHGKPLEVTVCRHESGAAIMAAPPSCRHTVTARSRS